MSAANLPGVRLKPAGGRGQRLKAPRVTTAPVRRPPRTAKARGSHFERRVRAHLEHDGYVVFRSAGSRSPADLIALAPGQVLLLQCKASGWIPPAERRELRALAARAGASPMLAYRDGRGLVLEALVEEAA